MWYFSLWRERHIFQLEAYQSLDNMSQLRSSLWSVLLLKDMLHVTEDCGLTVTNWPWPGEGKFSILIRVEIHAVFCMSHTTWETILNCLFLVFYDLVSRVSIRDTCPWSDNLIPSVGWCSVNRGMSGGSITEWTSKMRYVADKNVCEDTLQSLHYRRHACPYKGETALNSGLQRWIDRVRWIRYNFRDIRIHKRNKIYFDK